jgi:acetyl esterase
VEVTALRGLATFHDFVMLNALGATTATQAAIRLAANKLSEALSFAAEKSLGG